VLIVIDVFQEKFCFKEVNLINYFLEAFELMAQLKGAFSSDSFIITLIEMNVLLCLQYNHLPTHSGQRTKDRRNN
jgi:hypothetical protein